MSSTEHLAQSNDATRTQRDGVLQPENSISSWSDLPHISQLWPRFGRELPNLPFLSHIAISTTCTLTTSRNSAQRVQKKSSSRFDRTCTSRPPPEKIFQQLQACIPKHDINSSVIDGISGNRSFSKVVSSGGWVNPCSSQPMTPCISLRTYVFCSHLPMGSRRAHWKGHSWEGISRPQCGDRRDDCCHTSQNFVHHEKWAFGSQTREPDFARSRPPKCRTLSWLRRDTMFLNMYVHHCSCTYCLLITFLNSFLEYVPGGSIADCLRHHGKFDEEVTKSFTTQILGALAYLHSQGIVHGVRQRHIYLAITLTSSLF